MDPLDRLHDLLDEMEDLQDCEPTADTERAYFSARDAALDLIDEHPELILEGRAYGLPV